MTSPNCPAPAQQSLVQDYLYLGALLTGTLLSGVFSFLARHSLGLDQVVYQKAQLLWLILLFPVLEELIFRGGIQTLLLRSKVFNLEHFGLTGANWISSLLFCLLHLYSQPAQWAAALIVPSLIFGAFRDHYSSVIPGMGLHIFYNFGFFLPFLFPWH